MVTSFLNRIASFLVILSLLTTTAWSQGESGNNSRVAKKTARSPKRGSSRTSPERNAGKVVDMKHKVLFSLTLGKENQPLVDYKSLLNNKISRVPKADQASIKKIIKAEFKEPNAPNGVVIRVAKNVKYDMVNSLFKTIQSALVEDNIDKPIYISVEDPSPQQDPDDIRTQEFICKNKKAADLYDRVSNVARVFKVSVRLDPARNSITAKGPSSKVTAIQNLIIYLDKPVGGAPEPANNSSTPKKSVAETPKKSPIDSTKKKVEKSNSRPPNIQPTVPDNGTPKSSASPLDTDSSSKAGRYQLTGVGNNLFLLDTATGECWFLDPSRNEMRWLKLPHPKDNR